LIKDKKLKNIAKSTGTATLLNEYRKFIFCNASLAYRPMFKEAADKYKIKDWRIFWSLTPDEFRNLYFNDNKKILNILPQRKIAGVIMDPQKGYHVFDKLELRGVLKQIEKFTKQNTNISLEKELKWTVANLGYVKGRVKIIFDKKDFSKFKMGDILIAPMTSVDYVPLMQMASAFITNEGGLTSHAAIVSREMNKPCIIGTKIATKVFKDGDMVEVDANNGIIKKIN
jgi:phosphohistidine swiveling domain-containing protein